MTKPTKNETPVSTPEKPRRAGGFDPGAPVSPMWEALKNLQEDRDEIRPCQPETCRIWV